MPEGSVLESSEVTKLPELPDQDISAPKTDMRNELDNQIPPHAQNEVDKAVAEAATTEQKPITEKERQAAGREGRPVPGMAGGAILGSEVYGRPPGGLDLGDLTSRERTRERDLAERRAREALGGNRYFEYLRTSNNPEGLTFAGRMILISSERHTEGFDQYKSKLIQKTLLDRADELDPEIITLQRIDKYGLRDLGFAGTHPAEERDEGREREIGSLKEWLKDNDRYTPGREAKENRLKGLLEDKEQTSKEEVPEEARKELVDRMRAIAEEFRVREKAWIANRFVYRKSAGDLGTLAGHFTTPEYSEISSSEWQTLLSLPESEVGLLGFGEKIDLAMRLYALFGVAGRDTKEDDPKIADDLKVAIQKMKSEGGDSWMEGWITEQDLEFITGKNIFCDEPDESRGNAIREWVRRKISGKEVNGKKVAEEQKAFNALDTESAEGWAWDMFHMWGLAAQFDGKLAKGPEGYAASDDLVKLMDYKGWSAKEERRKAPHGPDATFGKYPDNLLVSFLHFTSVGDENDESIRSFWEKWFYEGVALGDLPWAKMDTDTMDKEQLFTLLDSEPEEVLERLKGLSQKGFAWRDYLLRVFFLGRKDGVHDIITNEALKREELVSTPTLRSISKALGIILNPSILVEGEWKEFFDKKLPGFARWKQENRGKFRKVETAEAELNWKAYISGIHDKEFDGREVEVEGTIDGKRDVFKENIVLGVSTAAYQNNSRAFLEWGWDQPNFFGAKNPGETRAVETAQADIPAILSNAGWGGVYERVEGKFKQFFSEKKRR